MVLPRLRHSPIGVTTDGRWLGAVQLSHGRDGAVISAATCIRRTCATPALDVAETSRLREVLDRQQFVGRSIVTAVPSGMLMTAVLELPPRDSGVQLDEISRIELAGAHKREPDETESAFWERPTPQRATRGLGVMAAGCVKDDANAVIDAFELAGFRVRGLDTTAWALSRAFASILDDPDEMVAVLNLRWDGAHVVVLAGSVIVYERALGGCSVQGLHRELIDCVEAGDDEAADFLLFEYGLHEEHREDSGISRRIHNTVRDILRDKAASIVSELGVSLAYVTQEYGASIDRLVIVGEGATIPGFVEQIGTERRNPTVALTPARLSSVAPALEPAADTPLLVTAFGLARYPKELIR